jgi:hypothetical protein
VIMSGLEWIQEVGDVPAATARGKYIRELCVMSLPDDRGGGGFVPEQWRRLSVDDFTTHALARLGYSHVGIASALDVGKPTARRYVRRVGRHMGREGLMAAPLGALDQWPRGPVCVTGERGVLAAHVAATDERNVTFGFELQSTDEGRRFVCKRHGNVSVITQRSAERVGLATGGSPLDNSGNNDSCRCISPLVRAGVW